MLGWAPSRRLALAGLIGLALLNLGILARSGDGWLEGPAWDDAYYYFSIARNLASGHGLTHAGLPTNGFQPLYLVLCYLVGSVVGWGPTALPAAMYAVNWLLAYGVGSLLAYRIGRVLTPSPDDRSGLLAVFAWLSLTNVARLVTNGMETALILMAWLGVILAFLRWRQKPSSRTRAAWLGLWLGIAFLARNDAVVLVLAVGVSMLIMLMGQGRRSPASLAPLILAAGITAAFASPWLFYNLVRFGHIVPQSGAAQGVGGLYDVGRLAQLQGVVAAAARNLCPLPVPLDRLSGLARMVAALVTITVMVVAVWRGVATSRSDDARAMVRLLATACGLLAVIYAALFGAPWMSVRWLAPFAVLGFLALTLLLHSLRAAALRGLCVLLLAGVCARLGVDGMRGMRTNTVPIARFALAHRAEAPIGTFQAGLPNWLMPDVVNLDGKTNREVLSAIRAGRLDHWLVASRVNVVVDFELFGLNRSQVVHATFDRTTADDGLVALRRIRR